MFYLYIDNGSIEYLYLIKNVEDIAVFIGLKVFISEYPEECLA